MHQRILMGVFGASLWLVQAAASQPFAYPLHVGDRWVYTPLGTEWISEIVGDSLLPNGKHYAVRTHDYHWFYGIALERQEGNKVYRYETSTNAERLWFDFDLSPGDTVSSFVTYDDTTDIILFGTETRTVFGVGRKMWWFLIDNNRNAVDDEQFVGVCDSLGMVEYGEMWGAATLRGALIGGRQYGELSDVGPRTMFAPSSFQLEQNYPNPFNPSTIISYTLPTEASVDLTVFNVLGQVVATLVRDIEGPGTKMVRFDGSGLPNGAYFYRLQVGSRSEMRMLSIVR